MIEVVNFRDVKQHWNRNTQQWDDPRYVYIGRKNARFGLPQSIWANPFPMKTEKDRGLVIAQFTLYVKSRKDLLGQLHALAGHTLVCWCAPLGCHGHVLAELVGALK